MSGGKFSFLKQLEKKREPATVAQGSAVPPEYILESVSKTLEEVFGYLKVAEIEKTKRVEIEARREVALESIRSNREVFTEMMRYTFAERAAALEKSFALMDRALESNNIQVLQSSLSAMLGVIQTSPFANMQQMQSLLSNKDFVLRMD